MRFDQEWCDTLAAHVGQSSAFAAATPVRVLYIVTETDEGKVAFSFADDGSELAVTAGKLPRGEKADITVTATVSVFSAIWSGERSREAAFMAGDIKVEGAYARWLDDLVPAFGSAPWAEAWAAG